MGIVGVVCHCDVGAQCLDGESPVEIGNETEEAVLYLEEYRVPYPIIMT